jgi:hypothetical protein
MRVFISHSSVDKPAVLPLADALRARGIDAWLDQYQIAPFADIVARINAGLSPHRRAALPTDEPILVRLRERVQNPNPPQTLNCNRKVHIPPVIRIAPRTRFHDLYRDPNNAAIPSC